MALDGLCLGAGSSAAPVLCEPHHRGFEAQARLARAAAESRRRMGERAARQMEMEVEREKERVAALEARREARNKGLFFRKARARKPENRLQAMLKAVYPGAQPEPQPQPQAPVPVRAHVRKPATHAEMPPPVPHAVVVAAPARALVLESPPDSPPRASNNDEDEGDAAAAAWLVRRPRAAQGARPDARQLGDGGAHSAVLCGARRDAEEASLRQLAGGALNVETPPRRRRRPAPTVFDNVQPPSATPRELVPEPDAALAPPPPAAVHVPASPLPALSTPARYADANDAEPEESPVSRAPLSTLASPSPPPCALASPSPPPSVYEAPPALVGSYANAAIAAAERSQRLQAALRRRPPSAVPPPPPPSVVARGGRPPVSSFIPSPSSALRSLTRRCMVGLAEWRW